MSPIGQNLVRDVPLLDADEPLATAIKKMVESGLPALPVCENGKLVGVLGERNVITAVVPGYVGELSNVAFVSASLDEALEHRPECVHEPVSKHMNTEHVEVQADFSYAQLAETFLHHRVALIPVVDDGRVTGGVTRRDYVRALAGLLKL